MIGSVSTTCGLKTSIELIRFCWSLLKPESCHGANFVLTGSTCAASEDKVGIMITCFFFIIKALWGMFSLIHTLIPRGNGRYLTNTSFKCIFLNEIYYSHQSLVNNCLSKSNFQWYIFHMHDNHDNISFNKPIWDKNVLGIQVCYWQDEWFGLWQGHTLSPLHMGPLKLMFGIE